MTPYGSLCDDFGVYAYLNTRLELPAGREPVLHFFDALQKSFPGLGDFERREGGEFSMEEDRETGAYRWVTLEPHRLCVGFQNPPELETADATASRVLELAPYHLDLSPLDCEALDVLFAFEFAYPGNHDEVVAEAFLPRSPLEGLLQMPGSRVLNFEPCLTFALDEKSRLQCRLNLETRTHPQHARTGQTSDGPISVYFTVRQHWDRRPSADFAESYLRQRRLCQELVDAHVIPNVVRPLAQAIAAR